MAPRVATGFPDDGPWRDIERMQRAMRGALGFSSAEHMRWITEQITGASKMAKVAEQVTGATQTAKLTEQITGASKMAKVAEQIAGMPQMRDLSQHFSQSEDFQRIARQIAGGNTQRISDQIAAAWRPEMVNLSRQIAEIVRAQQPALAGIAESLQAFQEAAAAGAAEFTGEEEGPDEEDSEASLGWWVASLTPVTQLAIFVAGLQVLDRVNSLIETTTGREIPDSLQSATQVCFAVVAFMLLWMQVRDDQGDE
jgi:hypothetical protein